MFKNEYTWGKAVENNAVSEFDEKFDTACTFVTENLGKDYPIIINGNES